MGKLDITSAKEQRRIAKWSTVISAAVCMVTFLLGHKALTVGIILSCFLMVLNYKALSLVPWIYQRFKSPIRAKVVAFIYYYLRFWLIIMVMFFTIPRGGYDFALGFLIGFLIPKVAMGAILIYGGSHDWWLERSGPAVLPEKELTALEKELLEKNPFEFNMVDFEWKSHNKKK